MHSKLKAGVLGAACMLFLNACSTMLTDYSRTQLPTVDSFEDAYKYVGSSIDAYFWKGFKDANLDRLIETAIRNNPDMKTALLNVRKAAIAVDLSYDDLLPTWNSSLSSSLSKSLDDGSAWGKTSSGRLTLSYATDLFGKTAAANRSALENYQATAYDYWACRLTIINSVADAYWQYAYAKEALEIGAEDLRDSQKRVSMIEGQYQHGAVSSVEVDKARINHLTVKNTLDAREHDFKKAKTALNTLLGVTADKEQVISSLDSSFLPTFSLDIPAKLLSRRPDLMAKEALVRKAYADVDQKRLAFYPDFTLEASLSGGNSNGFLNFLKNPVAALGAAITLPFLNWNNLQMQVDQAKTDREIADVAFVQAYIKAVQEVYDYVSAIELYRRSVVTLKDNVDLSRRNYEAYYNIYTQGGCSLNDLIDAADSLRGNEISYLQAKRNLLESVMGLMIALGGDTQEIAVIEDKKKF